MDGKGSSIIGPKKPELQELPRIRERISFLYVERCLINRKDGAITVTDIRGTAHIPIASLGVLLAGPGTNISHRAMELIGDAGASIIWVGERGVRFYAGGKPLTHSARFIEAQARLVSNSKLRVSVARKMYQKRFKGEDVSRLTMQQLRGREGARIRAVYRKMAKETGVKWDDREYDSENFDASDPVNKALSAGHACLYGICHSVINALGCSAGLGFIHTGHEKSFVYDIADLYKAETTIPLAFRLVAEDADDDIGRNMRYKMRDMIADGRIMERITEDITDLLLDNYDGNQKYDAEAEIETDIIKLWDDKHGAVTHGINYAPNEVKNDNDDFENIMELVEGYGEITDLK
jgi:CRISPR-associated protein Cas1